MHDPHKFTREPDGYSRMRLRLTPRDAALIEAAARIHATPDEPSGMPLPLYIKRTFMAQVHSELRAAGIDPDSIEYVEAPAPPDPRNLRFSA